MSDEIKKDIEDEKSTQSELQESDVDQIVGGVIPGGTTENKFVGWIELS